MRKGAAEFPPRWPAKKTLRVGYLLGRGRHATMIAQTLGDGTRDDTIRRLRRWADLKDFGKRRGSRQVPVDLSAHQYRILARLATHQGIDPEEWLRRVCAAAIEDDMYRAIVDDDED